MNYLAIIAAAVAAFIASAVWYIIFAKQRAELSSATTNRPKPFQILAELVRNLILVLVLVYLVQHLGVFNWTSLAHLALALWIGFPFILLTGSVMYEKVPWKLAAIHAGDWFIKLLLIIGILAVWH